MIRRFQKRAYRYIEAYAQKLSCDEADLEVQKFSSRNYRSHRRIGIED